MQREMPLMSVIHPPAMLDEALLERCATFKQALAVSMGLARSNASDASIADSLGLMPCVWSRIKNQPKNRPAYLSPDSLSVLSDVLGNRGVLQWLAMQQGCRIVPREETRAQRLRRELAELEAQEAVA